MWINCLTLPQAKKVPLPALGDRFVDGKSENQAFSRSHAFDPEQQPVFSNLYQLYIHSFTDFVEQPLSDNGRFGYNPLPPYCGKRITIHLSSGRMESSRALHL
jgi:hypothetical protein